MTDAPSARERRAKRKAAEADAAQAEERRARRAEQKRQRDMAAEITKSVNKASTARAHRRPPPLERANAPRRNATEMLSAFMELSVNIIHEALHAEVEKGQRDDGTPIMVPDLKTRRNAAQYVVDKVVAAEGTYLPEGLPFQLDNTSDVLEMGRKIVELVVCGHMSVEAGQKVFGVLQNYAALQGLNELEALRELVAKLTGEQARTINGDALPGADQNPVWMRLNNQRPS